MASWRPIKVSENGRYFVDAAGDPFFWLGDTAWPLFAQYTRDEAETYLDARAGQGFNVAQAVLAWGGGTGYEANAPGPNYLGDAPWLEDPAHPNDAYFQHVDHLARYAAERGIVLAMLPTWGYYVNDVQALTPDSARAYGRWLGERYRQQPNIVWVNGGDRIPTGFESTYRALAEGLREGDGGAHLITYHPCGWRSSGQFWHQEPWLDFNMIQTWTDWAKIYPAVAADFGLTPVKPVVLAEPAYETGPEYPQGPITPHVMRREAWWAFMAGGFFTYGHNQNWRMEPGWLTELTSAPGATHMSLLKSIAASRPWWQMVPDQGVFESGVSSERSLNAALRSTDGQCVMAYLSTHCHALIRVDKIEARQARATLLNPATGEERDAGIHSTGNYTGAVFPRASSVWFSVPGFWEDAVLILDAVS
jgi:hypothetical protein